MENPILKRAEEKRLAVIKLINQAVMLAEEIRKEVRLIEGIGYQRGWQECMENHGLDDKKQDNQ